MSHKYVYKVITSIVLSHAIESTNEEDEEKTKKTKKKNLKKKTEVE